MASIYRRKDSPFFWIKFRDKSGRLRQESTRFRGDSAEQIRKARHLEAKRTEEELESGTISAVGHGWSWVAGFLETRYKAKPVTLERYLEAWRTIVIFLDQIAIESPAHLARKHCYDYVTWRGEPDKAIGKYRAKHNTALMDLKVLRIIMSEALERRMVGANPVLRLGIERERPKEKPELTPEDCEAIRRGIEAVTDPARKEMLSLSFEIARFQGCRLSETRLNPMTDVDLEAGTIRFRSAKGGKDFVTRLHPAIIPLFTKLKSDGRSFTWNKPDNVRSRQWASGAWFKFLAGIGLKAKGITFHSTRVTVITELARNDVHESKAQAYVGHASTTVHRIYQRLRPADLKECVDAVGGSARSGSSSAT